MTRCQPPVRSPSLQSREVHGDRADCFVGETPSQGAHDVCPVVAARAALELRQLLHDVGLTLAGQAGIALGAHGTGQVTADARRHPAVRLPSS